MSEPSQDAQPISIAREDFAWLTDEQWGYGLKLDAINGRSSTASLLAQDPVAVVAYLDSFCDYERALETHVLDVVTSRMSSMQAPPPAPAPVVTVLPSPAPPAGPKPLRVPVSKYSGTESENLTFWQREVELAMTAARATDERQKVTFAMSNMDGRAKVWALTCETNHPGYFQSWRALSMEMQGVFEPPNVAHRQRAAFLASVQGTRELYEYVQELRQLRASMAANALAEDVMLTVFMDCMKVGPAKAAVFREEPQLLEDAFRTALREDYIQRLSRGLSAPPTAADSRVPTPAALPPGEPMDVSSVENLLDLSQINLEEVDLRAIDASALHIKCYTCGKFGHFQRDCPRNRGQRTFRGRGHGRRSGRGSAPRGGRGHASQGNEQSQ